MDQSQLNESYKAKHMLTTFPPAPPVLSTFVQAAQIAAQWRSEQVKCNANNGNTIGTQENSHQPQRLVFDELLVNVPTFETEYQDFAPLKRAMEAVFSEAWEIYT